MPDIFSISAWRNLFQRMGTGCGWALAAIFGVPLVIGFGLNQYAGRGAQNRVENRNETVMTVNGDSITANQFANALSSKIKSMDREGRSVPPGEMFAFVQGQVLESLITQEALIQEAQRRNLHAGDADIDKYLAAERAAILGKDDSDSKWEQYVLQAHGLGSSEYRQEVAKQMLIPALIESVKDSIKVTDEEVKNHNGGEVKLALIVVSTTPSKKGKPLTDAEAKQKAQALLANIKGGADFAAIAKANSDDTATKKKGGEMDFRPEFRPQNPQFASLGLGNFLYGKDFDEALHKTPKGQLTDVVKVTGFASGYAFAKVLDRRMKLPDKFDLKKETEALKDERASETLIKLSQEVTKKAKVEITDPDKKACYDLVKLQQFGRDAGETPPSPADFEKQKAQVESEFEAALKRHPDDVTLAAIVASSLKSKLAMATPEQRNQINDRLIQLYIVTLKTTENRPLRFELAALYRDKKQTDLAIKQYETIQRLLNASPPYDLSSMQQQADVRKQLIGGFNSVGQPAAAKQEQDKLDELKVKIAEETKKEAARKAATPQGNSPQLTLPSGGQGTITLPPSGGGKPDTKAGGKSDIAAPKSDTGKATP